jgi:hypothetical protein
MFLNRVSTSSIITPLPSTVSGASIPFPVLLTANRPTTYNSSIVANSGTGVMQGDGFIGGPTGYDYAYRLKWAGTSGGSGALVFRMAPGDAPTTTVEQSKTWTSTNAVAYPRFMFFDPTGTRLFIGGNAGTSLNSVSTSNTWIAEYTLSTAWDLTTASSSPTRTKDLTSITASSFGPESIHIDTTGTYLWISGYSTNYVRILKLTTPWDITTATAWSNKLLTNAAWGTNTGIVGIYASDDGRQFLTWQNTSYTLTYWSVSTAFNLSSTLTATNYGYTTLSTVIGTNSRGMNISRRVTDDSQHMYMIIVDQNANRLTTFLMA